jgi:elongation factor 1-gamma
VVGYSIYYLHYEKLASECKVLFETSNLLDGFIQRVDNKGKYGFGVHAIVGEEPNLELKGVWMLRGADIPKFMIDHPTFEFYKKRKLDITKAEDKKLIEDYWCSEEGEMIEGLKYMEGKYFR